MTALANRALYWAPRALCIAFIAFVSVFALDAFGADRPLWQTLAALAMHLFPSFVLLGILVLAWRQEWIGAAGCAALGLLLLWRYGFDTLGFVLFIPGPLFLIAALFLINWLKRGQLHAGR